MITREVILLLCSVATAIVGYVLFSKHESAEESAIFALASVLALGTAFPHFCQWGLSCLYEQPPTALYTGAYAAVGAVSVGFIADYEIEHRIKPYLGDDLTDKIKIFIILASSSLVGLVMWRYDTIIGLPVSPYIASMPMFWIMWQIVSDDDSEDTKNENLM